MRRQYVSLHITVLCLLVDLSSSPAVTHVHSRKTSDRGRGGSGQRSGGRYIPLSLSNDHVRRRSSSLEDINVRRRAGSGTNDRIQGRGGSSSIKSRSRTPSPRGRA